jgi:hypothetical protein
MNGLRSWMQWLSWPKYLHTPFTFVDNASARNDMQLGTGFTLAIQYERIRHQKRRRVKGG